MRRLTEALNSPYADTGTESVIPLPNVTGKILGKVIEYCKYHVEVRDQAASYHLQNDDHSMGMLTQTLSLL